MRRKKYPGRGFSAESIPDFESLTERFWKKVQKTEGCWRWRGTLNSDGYGIAWCGSRLGRQLAHRVAWVIAHGALPARTHVLHTCDMPACVRPDHLVLGDAKLNSRHRIERGRMVVFWPLRWLCKTCGDRKLTDGQNDLHTKRWFHITEQLPEEEPAAPTRRSGPGEGGRP